MPPSENHMVKKKKKKNPYKPYVPARVVLHRHVSTIQ